MTKRPQLLVIGHSHIECLTAAYDKQTFDADVQFINLRLLEQDHKDVPLFDKVKKQTRGLHPSAVCLCIGGNLHNILGLIENPIPFCVGASDVGAIPADVGSRKFIPNALMTEVFENNLRRNLTFSIYTAFPNAKRLYMNAPPPIGDFEHIKKHPGVFRDKIELGSSPPVLKLHLYRIQTKTKQSIAQEAKATFVDVVPELVDDQGFLAPKFYNADPTHGNSEYGDVMLREILQNAGAPA